MGVQKILFPKSTNNTFLGVSSLICVSWHCGLKKLLRLLDESHLCDKPLPVLHDNLTVVLFFHCFELSQVEESRASRVYIRGLQHWECGSSFWVILLTYKCLQDYGSKLICKPQGQKRPLQLSALNVCGRQKEITHTWCISPKKEELKDIFKLECWISVN